MSDPIYTWAEMQAAVEQNHRRLMERIEETQRRLAAVEAERDSLQAVVAQVSNLKEVVDAIHYSQRSPTWNNVRQSLERILASQPKVLAVVKGRVVAEDDWDRMTNAMVKIELAYKYIGKGYTAILVERSE